METVAIGTTARPIGPEPGTIIDNVPMSPDSPLLGVSHERHGAMETTTFRSGETSLRGAEVEIVPSPEFRVGDVTFTYKGPAGKDYVFESRDDEGVTRMFLVYQSNSGGSERVSQGSQTWTDAAGKRRHSLIKGPELSRFAQYTQDTQLHPDFQEVVAEVSERKDFRHFPQQAVPEFDEAARRRSCEDFEHSIATYGFGHRGLDELLARLPAGSLGSRDVRALTGYDPIANRAESEQAFMNTIGAVNTQLRQSGVMPDFAAEPSTYGISEHPLLGHVVTETFTNTINGRAIEWQMCRDKHGRAWIERIRLGDTTPSAYGTDKEMIFSGILTSKPYEYAEQADGIPAKYLQAGPGSYVDMTGFLAELAPVQEYMSHAPARNDRYSIFWAQNNGQRT